MNTDVNAFPLSEIQPACDDGHHLADIEVAHDAPPDTAYLQSEAPCSCPGCFPLWD